MSPDEALQHGLRLLKERLAEHKIVIAEHLAEGFRESLGKVRYAADGSVDLTSVDSRIRAMAWGVLGIEEREEQKKSAPLADVQKIYFEFIHQQFGDLFDQMTERGHNPHTVSTAISRDTEMVTTLKKSLPDFLAKIVEFWGDFAEPTWANVQDTRALKAVFGGDLFPSSTQNIASTCGLYVETIVLTDPFMNSKAMFSRWAPDNAVRYLLKHALNILQYRELALAETKSPIVLIVPFRSSWDPAYPKYLAKISERDGLVHASNVFGRSFVTKEELFDFAGNLDTPEKIVSEVARPDRLLFDTTFTDPLERQIVRVAKEYGPLMGTANPGTLVALQCLSRMMQATEIVEKSRELGGTPLIDAPTSWTYFNWKMEYGAEIGSDDVPLHVMKGLHAAAETEMTWLGRVPPKSLIEIRQQGADEEIRKLLSAGVREIAGANPTNFFRTTDKVINNLTAAFSDHERQISTLRDKKWKFAVSDIGSWIVVGGIAIAATVTGTPVMALAALGASELLDAPKLRELPGKAKAIAGEDDALKKSPVGLLFKISQNS